MASKITTEQFIERARSVHGNKYDYGKAEYKGTHTKVIITCPIHGDFPQTPHNHISNGNGCPDCFRESKKRGFDSFVVEANELHGHKYEYDKSTFVDMSTKMDIRCPVHGVFQQSPSVHLEGHGCSDCGTEAMADACRKSQAQFIRELKEIFGDSYDYSQVEYVNSHTNVTLTCPVHGEFTKLPSDLLQGSGCAKCSGIRDTETFIAAAREVHGNKYDYSEVEYVRHDQEVKIICPEHGAFWQTPTVHVHAGCGCRECSEKTFWNTESFIAKAREVHGDKYGYDKVEYVNFATKVMIFCKEHNGYFEQYPQNHMRGNGCDKCYHDSRCDDLETFIRKAREIHGNKYDYSEVEYKNSRTEITVICPNHGPFPTTPNRHISGGCGCPACRDAQIWETKKKNGTCNASQPEETFYELLLNKFGEDDVKRQYADEQRYPFHCDFYIPSRDLFIELNGHWTHGTHPFDEDDPEDMSKLEEWRTKAADSAFYRTAIDVWTRRDVDKREYAQKNNLNYHIFYGRSVYDDAKAWLELQD